jgi:hypothetical protein
MPTGWRPSDVAEKYPVYKIQDVYRFDKYDTKASPALYVWSWMQLVMILLFVSYLFGSIAVINQFDSTYIFVYGGFIFLSIYAFTELMDRNQYAIAWEALRCGFGIYLIYQQGDWFGASELIPGIHIALMAYFVIATLITGWFVYIHYKEDRQQKLSMQARASAIRV